MNARHIKKIALSSDVETKVNSSANDSADRKLEMHTADYPVNPNTYDPSTYKPHVQASERTAWDLVVDEAVRTTNITQSIAGTKTFTGTVNVPAPTSSTNASTKKYVDDSIETTVTLAGTQTIMGSKTFNISPIVPTPTSNSQAATKKYVDDAIAASGGGGGGGGGGTYTAGTGLTLNGTEFSLDGTTQTALSDSATHIADTTIHVTSADKTTWDSVASSAVKTSGNQNISGTKTFTGAVIVPTPTSSTNATTKSYVDGKLTDGSVTKIGTSDVGTDTKPIKIVAGVPTVVTSALALDTAVVHNTGAETVDGVKTFRSSPIVPTPTTDYQVATKKYVDDNAGGGGGGGGTTYTAGTGLTLTGNEFSLDSTTQSTLSNAVLKTGNQTVAGVKTFTANPQIRKTRPIFWAIDSSAATDYNVQYAQLSVSIDDTYSTERCICDVYSQSDGIFARVRVKSHDGSYVISSVLKVFDADGSAYMTAPTYIPTDSNGNYTSVSNDIVITEGRLKVDPNVVHSTGAETVAGVKTFSSSPIVPTPTTDYQAATKKYVDDHSGGGGSSSTWTALTSSNYRTMLSTLFTESNGVYTANYDVSFDAMFRYGASDKTYAKFVVPKGTAAPLTFSSVGTFQLTSATYAVMSLPFSAVFGTGDMAVIVYRKNTTSGHMRVTIHNTSTTSTTTASDTVIGKDLLTYSVSSTPYTGTSNKYLYMCISYR